MTLKKGFLHRKLHFSEIPVTRKFMGPFIGILVAIAFYALLYLLRDICRAMPALSPEHFWALSEDELSFYNFFYAAVASLLGQSICFAFWLNRPRHITSPQRLTRIRVLHDQRFFIWYFLAWFSKVAFVYGLFFGWTLWGGHYVFSFYPDYRFLFYLILIVLFLQSWTSFRLLFPRQTFKWILVSALVLVSFSFGLSKINLLDQEAFQYSRQRESIYYKYDFELPQSAYYENVYHSHLSIKVQLVLDFSVSDSPSILLDQEKINPSSLPQKLRMHLSMINKYERHRASVSLYADHRVPIAFVEKVKTAISRAGISKLYYMVVPVNPEFDVRYYDNLGIPYGVSNNNYPIDSLIADSLLSAKRNFPTPSVTVSIEKIRIDSDKMDQNQLVSIFAERIKEEPGKIIRYNYNPQDPLSKYIRVLSAAHLAMESIRQKAFQRADTAMTDYETYILQEEIKSQYPVRFLAIPKK